MIRVNLGNSAFHRQIYAKRVGAGDLPEIYRGGNSNCLTVIAGGIQGRGLSARDGTSAVEVDAVLAGQGDR